MSPFLAFIGISVIGTWGLASIGIIVAGIFMIFVPGDALTASSPTLGGIVFLAIGVVSMGLMGLTVTPLLGIDPPFPMPAKKIIPASRLTKWARAGQLRDFPDGKAKEVRLLTKRVTIIRMGDNAYALHGLCSHARLPLGGISGAPIKVEPVRDGCVTCPFHGARFEVETGKVVRQPFDSSFNQEHPFLGGLQSKLFSVLSKLPTPPGAPRPSMHAEDMQTYPVRIENGDIFVALPPR